MPPPFRPHPGSRNPPQGEGSETSGEPAGGAGWCARTAGLGEESRGARKRADETAHHPLDGHGQLPVEVGGEGSLMPSSQPRARSRFRSPTVAPERSRASGRARSPRRGVRPPHVQRRVRERVGAAAFDTPINAGTMAEQVHGPEREAGGHALRAGPRIEGTEAPQGEAEEGGLRVAVGGEPGETLDHPRPCPSRSRCSRTRTKGCTMSKWSTRHQLAAARVEEDELPQCEKLKRTPEAGAHPPRRLGHSRTRPWSRV